MTEAMPFLQNYDITFLRPPPICADFTEVQTFRQSIPQVYAFRPQKVVAAQRLFLSILGGVVQVYSEVKNRVLYAEKAHLSTSERHFPKGTYNILILIEMRRKVIAAQRLFSLKCRYPTAGSVHPQFRCRRIETGFSGSEYDSLTARKTQGKPIVAQALFHRYYSTSQPLPMLLTPTPNVI